MATALFVADAEKVATVTVADNVEPAEGVSVAKVEVEAVASPVAEAHAVPVAENVRTPVPVEAVEGVAEEEAALGGAAAAMMPSGVHAAEQHSRQTAAPAPASSHNPMADVEVPEGDGEEVEPQIVPKKPITKKKLTIGKK